MRQYFHKYTIWLKVDTIPILWIYSIPYCISYTRALSLPLSILSFFNRTHSHAHIWYTDNFVKHTFTLTFRSFDLGAIWCAVPLCYCPKACWGDIPYILYMQHETLATNNGLKTAKPKTKTNNQQPTTTTKSCIDFRTDSIQTTVAIEYAWMCVYTTTHHKPCTAHHFVRSHLTEPMWAICKRKMCVCMELFMRTRDNVSNLNTMKMSTASRQNDNRAERFFEANACYLQVLKARVRKAGVWENENQKKSERQSKKEWKKKKKVNGGLTLIIMCMCTHKMKIRMENIA